MNFFGLINCKTLLFCLLHRSLWSVSCPLLPLCFSSFFVAFYINPQISLQHQGFLITQIVGHCTLQYMSGLQLNITNCYICIHQMYLQFYTVHQSSLLIYYIIFFFNFCCCGNSTQLQFGKSFEEELIERYNFIQTITL